MTITRSALLPKTYSGARLQKSAPEVRGDIRKKVISNFPYSILYAIENDLIVIVAVAHHKRRPIYWHRRVRK